MTKISPMRRSQAMLQVQHCRSRRTPILCRCLALWALLCSVFPASAQFFVCQGAGEWKTYMYDELKEQYPLAFTACAGSTNDCAWLIEFSYPNQYLEKIVSRPDGSNIVTIAYYKPEYTNASGTNSINGYGFVEKATIPRGDGYLPLSAIWLAFDSPCYLDNLKTNRISPPYFKDGRADTIGYYTTVPFAATRQASHPRFAIGMSFFHDGRSINQRREWVQAPKPFHGGFTNAIFTVVRYASKESSAGSIPMEFTLDYFYPLADSRDPNSWRLYLTQTCRLWVTNAYETNAVTSLIPEVPPRVSYQDRRFMSSETPELRFAYRSDRYLSDAEVVRLGAFTVAQRKLGGINSARLSGMRTVPVTASAQRILIVSMLVLLSLGPIVFMWYRKCKTNRKEHKL